MKLLVATANTHKLREIREIFSLPGVEFVGLDAFPGLPPVDEDGDTFAQNAVKKAVVSALAVKLWAMADDSGLEVDSLGGAPGVRSARYAGEPVDYGANNRKLLAALAGVEDRRARFRCVIALSSPAGRAQFVEGRCEGRIIGESRGANGFGYDPLFVPDGYDQTFAEMAGEAKNRISHRGLALKQAVETWGELLRSGSADWLRSARKRVCE